MNFLLTIPPAVPCWVCKQPAVGYHTPIIDVTMTAPTVPGPFPYCREHMPGNEDIAALRTRLSAVSQVARELREALIEVDAGIVIVQASDRTALLTAQHRRAIDDTRMLIRIALSKASALDDGGGG